MQIERRAAGGRPADHRRVFEAFVAEMERLIRVRSEARGSGPRIVEVGR
ncbi:hypothetical protein [Amorphus coralli]|nr:hypothetical protein [Amorphus coralli]